jgi:exodeoxyribonuclease III
LRLVTWNVAGRVSRQPQQAAAIAALGADLVALQEVTARTLPLWQVELERAGFTSVKTALKSVPPAGRRQLGVLTAARRPLRELPPPEVPWPERLLCCALGGREIVNLHSPISPAPDLAKIRTHEAVAAYLEGTPPGVPRILCGDLNTPRRELPDGRVLTFAHDSAGRLRPERGERWHRAESALVHGLRQQGWVDAFRSLHGYDEREASWRFPQDRGGWRLDHVLVHGLRPLASAYAHDWRRSGLSDHSALVVDLEEAS